MKQPVIAIDCSPLLVNSAGVKTHLYHWMKALQVQAPDTIRTFLAPSKLDRLRHKGGLLLHPGRLAFLVGLNRLPAFAGDLAAPGCDIFHCSNQLRNFPRRPKLTGTLYDLTPWLLPECHTSATLACDQAFADRVLKRAAGIIAISESTKRDAVKILGLAPDKMRVVYPGVPEKYFSVDPEAAKRVVAARDLRKPYFLSVGTIEPRKNIDTLLSAWEALPQSFRAEYDLVIAGMPGWRSEATMKRLAQQTQDGGSIRHLGYVPEDDLPGLTAGALALVYPSLYEGFGIPVAQAMAAGRPVITSNISSLPEVAGAAAMLIDPHSVEELKNAMMKLAGSEDLQRQMGAAGREKAKRYTWERAAADSLSFFREL